MNAGTITWFIIGYLAGTAATATFILALVVRKLRSIEAMQFKNFYLTGMMFSSHGGLLQPEEDIDVD